MLANEQKLWGGRGQASGLYSSWAASNFHGKRHCPCGSWKAGYSIR